MFVYVLCVLHLGAVGTDFRSLKNCVVIYLVIIVNRTAELVGSSDNASD
jgi:hypothetical protein